MGLMFVLNKNFTPSEPIIFDTKQGTWSLGVLTIPAGGLQKEEETELLEAYTRDMQEMELETLPLKTEQEIIDEQARHELEQQLNVHRQLVLKAKDRLSQTEKKVADAKILHGQANLKVSEAKAKVEKLAREADLVAKEEEFERQRLSFEATLEAVRSEHVKERSEQERRLQQMEARLEALASANVVLHL
ncbi:hypothetical protein BS47DRAFT_127390 [Hydnum rufescens UP504]|uniref:Uncharacterized protein n=1 Tax=Hydnum rufescens UP504 TaxID=1448309 RepID=A0A9P6DP94_9AGAM|nr:hypothetical protein BS47DRAFT_127390 [Hydnum rufescens UP504]